MLSIILFKGEKVSCVKSLSLKSSLSMVIVQLEDITVKFYSFFHPVKTEQCWIDYLLTVFCYTDYKFQTVVSLLI